MAISVNATQTIMGYLAAGAVDPNNDYLLGYNSSAGAYRRYNRNTFLGISGAPVGTTDVQTLVSKTLTSPTINGATLNGTISGTYNFGGTPTFPASVATLSGSQTLTNKTLTSPVITGGTVSNASVSVDSISGFTTPTIVTVGGVQMNNGVIGTSGAVTSNSVAAGAITPNALTAGSGTGWSWATFTPTFANLTLGNGTVNARYTQTGKQIWIFMTILLGNTSAVGTDPSFVVPVSASNLYTTTGLNVVSGYGTLLAGSTNVLAAPFFNASSGSIHIGYIQPSATNNALTVVNATTPGTWGTNSQIIITCFYEAA